MKLYKNYIDGKWLESETKDIIQVDQIDFILAPTALQYANTKHDITKRVTEKLNEQKE
mgnify:CR=1 FL=1